jgi:uncharacterized protein
MAQPNVAREPSMEEILASIRRIIESNETNGEPGRDGQFANQFDADDEIVLDDEADDGFATELAANDRGLPSSYGQAPELHSAHLDVANLDMGEAAPAQERSLSLADVAARVRAASARQQEHASAARAPEIRAPQLATVTELRGTISPVAASVSAPLASEPVADLTSEPLRPAAPARSSMPDFASISRPPMPPMPREQVEPAPAVVREAEIPAVQLPVAAASVSRGYDAPPVTAAEAASLPPVELKPAPVAAPLAVSVPAAAAPAETLPAKIEDAAATLLSETAGAQVAKSFNELAAVFDGLERRSVEEMAQEMLRPMLQEWLDDNLPTLVERLVREEIERVARGSRR